MVQLLSVLVCADNTGAKSLRIIGKLGGTRNDILSVGDIISCVVHRGSSQAQIKTHEKVKAIVIRTKKEIKRADGSYIRFGDNAAVIIDIKSKEPKGTAIFGPVARELRDKGFLKLVSLADEVL